MAFENKKTENQMYEIQQSEFYRKLLCNLLHKVQSPPGRGVNSIMGAGNNIRQEPHLIEWPYIIWVEALHENPMKIHLQFSS
ncbi:hypothetical protein BK146_23045 [Paenibacillus sp. FSL R7-0333]|nr:hypothetical protein BK146_23045 [Paenibacillus sp. FSL R7-0333]